MIWVKTNPKSKYHISIYNEIDKVKWENIFLKDWILRLICKDKIETDYYHSSTLIVSEIQPPENEVCKFCLKELRIRLSIIESDKRLNELSKQ